MTEGPTARYKAWLIYNKMRGKEIKAIRAISNKINVELNKLIGKRFIGFDTFGKNIVFIFDEYAIRLHLMLYGSIHIYKRNETLKKNPKLIRLDIVLDNYRLVVYNAPIVEINYSSELLKKLKKIVGEDPLRNDWNPNRAIALLKKNKNKAIGEVLLDQKVIAGVGNILRNEILFRARVHPNRLVSDLSDNEIKNIIKISEDLMQEWFELKKKGEKISRTILIYGKSGKPCPICGGTIRFYRQKPHNRRTYFCPNCQR